MVNCTFCGYAIKAGTGKMLVLKDGKIQYFCKMKCEKNLHKLSRKPRTTSWTRAHAIQKAADIAAAQSKAEEKKPEEKKIEAKKPAAKRAEPKKTGEEREPAGSEQKEPAGDTE